MVRPREFDRDDALNKAMRLFWAHGYDQTSISQLTEGMGISSPSLYAAFGDKRRLFEDAVECYESGPTAVARRAMAADTATEVFDAMMDLAVTEYCRPGNPRGCMVISDPTCAAQRGRCRNAIAARLRKAQKAGDLPQAADPRALADYTFAVLTGLSTLARDGGTRRQLRATADVARQSWAASLALAAQTTDSQQSMTSSTSPGRHHPHKNLHASSPAH
jgi:AcrR family transcriptional regulator